LNAPQNKEFSEERRDDFPSVSEVRKTLLAALSSLKQRIAYITFSGNGEPTLHPDFPEIVDIVREIRDRYVSRAKLAILSNSTTINNPVIATALMKLDSPIMKLDAGSEKVFKKINRPAKGADFHEIIEGLIKFDHPGLVIQALLVGGDDLNSSDENIERWASFLKKIKPSQVQIYSLDRPPARLDISRLSMSELNSIARKVTDMTGIPVTAF
jgi:wyosine [tRNA(Phe)-imidazoG37] synthetase (radical SAM superfamily)